MELAEKDEYCDYVGLSPCGQRGLRQAAWTPRVFCRIWKHNGINSLQVKTRYILPETINTWNILTPTSKDVMMHFVRNYNLYMKLLKFCVAWPLCFKVVCLYLTLPRLRIQSKQIILNKLLSKLIHFSYQRI